MEIIIKNLNHKLDLSNYLDGKSCFIDIETTGLSKYKNTIYLIGLLYPTNNNNWILKQFFSHNKTMEKDILKEFMDKVVGFDKIITYNGNTFDIPFINYRLQLHNIDKSIDKDRSFDLYSILRKNKDFLDIENLKLKTVEEYLGYYRDDIYSGYDCIQFYKDYVSSKDMDLKNRVLNHNQDDLIYMLDVMKIIDVLNEKKSINLSLLDKEYSWIINDFNFLSNTLNISGKISPSIDYDIREYGFEYDLMTKNKNQFYLNIHVLKGLIDENTKSYFINLDDYNLINSSIECQYSKLYSLNPNIYLLSIGPKPLLDNIKSLAKMLIKIKT